MWVATKIFGLIGSAGLLDTDRQRDRKQTTANFINLYIFQTSFNYRTSYYYYILWLSIFFESRKFVVRFSLHWRPLEGIHFHWTGLKKFFLQFKLYAGWFTFHWRDSDIFPVGLKFHWRDSDIFPGGFIIPLEGFRYPSREFKIPPKGFR